MWTSSFEFDNIISEPSNAMQCEQMELHTSFSENVFQCERYKRHQNAIHAISGWSLSDNSNTMEQCEKEILLEISECSAISEDFIKTKILNWVYW